MKQIDTKSIKTSVEDCELSNDELEVLAKESGLKLDKLFKSWDSLGLDSVKALRDNTKKFIASDATPDRYGDIINPKGWEVEDYKKNPVFLNQHMSHKSPIGNAVKIKTTEKALEMHVLFHRLTPESEEIFKLYDNGIMRAVSVGFMPLEIKDIKDEKERSELGLGRWGNYFEKQSLLELSAVTIPANPNALLQDKDFLNDLIDNKDFFNIVVECLQKEYGPELKSIKDLNSQIRKLEDQLNKLSDIALVKAVSEEVNNNKGITNEEVEAPQLVNLFKAFTTNLVEGKVK